MIVTKTYTLSDLSKSEILRYAGCPSNDEYALHLLDLCAEEIKPIISCKVCYCVLPVNIVQSQCDFSVFKAESHALSKNLSTCEKVLLFAATIGSGIDRSITRYSAVSPSKSVIANAIGSERIEALCDTFIKDYELENSTALLPRFSPGYGDLDINIQKDIFRVLDCPIKIGLSLTDSLIMTPSKSVTAFAGITKPGV